MSDDLLNIDMAIDRLFEVVGILRCASRTVDHIVCPDRNEDRYVTAVGRAAEGSAALLESVIEFLEFDEGPKKKAGS